MGWVALLNSKPAISLKQCKIGQRLVLMTNRKSHTRFRLVSKSTTLDDLERPLRTPFQNTCVFQSPPSRKFEWRCNAVSAVNLRISAQTSLYCQIYIRAADSVSLSSFKFSWWAPKDACVLKQSA